MLLYLFPALSLDVQVLSSDALCLASFCFLAKAVRSDAQQTLRQISIQTLSSLVVIRLLHILGWVAQMHYRPDLIPSLVFFLFDVVNFGIVSYIMVALLRVILSDGYDLNSDAFGKSIFRKIAPTSLHSYRMAHFLVFQLLVFGIGVVWWLATDNKNLGMVTSAFQLVYRQYSVLSVLALIPQLYMFFKNRVVSISVGNFFIFYFLSRVTALVFYFVYPYLRGLETTLTVPIIVELINCALTMPFVQSYTKALKSGSSVVNLPALNNMV